MTLTHRYEVCRLCVHYIKDGSQILIDTYTLRPENISLKNVITICMPEIDLDRTVQRHICGSCLLRLRGVYTYKCKILKNEQQIVKYFHDNKLSSRNKLDLNYLVKEDDESESFSSSVDHTFRSLMNLDTPIPQQNGMCFYRQTQYKCFMCDFSSTVCESLTHHYRDVHNKKVTITIEDLADDKNDEMPMLKPNAPFKCEYPTCDYQSLLKHNYIQHKSNHLKNFVCGKCNERFAHAKTCYHHTKVHKERGIAIKCSLCDCQVLTFQDARRHYFQQHHNYDLSKLPLPLDDNSNECDLKTLTDDLSVMLDSFENDLHNEKSFKKEESPKEETFNCKSCSYVCISRSILENHEKEVHLKKRKSESPTVKNIFQCLYCHYRADNPLSIQGHTNSKHSRRTLPLSKQKSSSSNASHKSVPPITIKKAKLWKVEGSQAKVAQKLKSNSPKPQPKSTTNSTKPTPVKPKPEENVKKGDRKRPFGCEYCESTFTTLDKFREHFSADHTDKMLYFRCGLCPVKSRFTHKLKMHQKARHNLIKCWAAMEERASRQVKRDKQKSLSNKTIQQENSTKVGFGTFHCEHCTTVCDHYEKYLRHLMIHTRPFGCLECDLTSSWVKFIKNHTISIHKVKSPKVKCTICEFIESDITNMNNHFNDQHKNTKRHLGNFYDEYNRIINEVKEKTNTKNGKVENDAKNGENTEGKGENMEEATSEEDTRSKTKPLVEITVPLPIISDSEIKKESEEKQDDIEQDDVEHIDSSAVDKNDQDEEYEFICPDDECDFKSGTVEDLLEHKRTKHSEAASSDNKDDLNDSTLMIKCCFCDYASDDKATLRKHYSGTHQFLISADSEKENDKIDVVSKDAEVADKTGDDDKTDVVSVVKLKHSCKICTYSTDDGSEMTKHSEKHVESPFICVQCEQSFSQRNDLIKHLYDIHDLNKEVDTSGEKLSDIEECSESSLLATVKYSCDRCSYRSTDNEKMKTHHLNCKKKRSDIVKRQISMNTINIDPFVEDDINKNGDTVSDDGPQDPLASPSVKRKLTLENEDDGKAVKKSNNSGVLVIETEEEAAQVKATSLLLTGTEMEDPFESDPEDYGSLEEAIASINVPQPMIIKNELDTLKSAMSGDNDDALEFEEEAPPSTSNIKCEFNAMDDFVLIEDDDD